MLCYKARLRTSFVYFLKLTETFSQNLYANRMTIITQGKVTNTTEGQIAYAVFFEYLLVERASINNAVDIKH